MALQTVKIALKRGIICGQFTVPGGTGTQKTAPVKAHVWSLTSSRIWQWAEHKCSNPKCDRKGVSCKKHLAVMSLHMVLHMAAWQCVIYRCAICTKLWLEGIIVELQSVHQFCYK